MINWGGWSFVQMKSDCAGIDFNHHWNSYKSGFGNEECFWLGLENLHLLTNQPGYRAVLGVQGNPQGSGGCHAQAHYKNIKVGDETSGYELSIETDANEQAHWPLPDCPMGDSLLVQGGNMSVFNMKFSTSDQDNDNSTNHCAQMYESGWWFNDCSVSNLNGHMEHSTVRWTAFI